MYLRTMYPHVCFNGGDNTSIAETVTNVTAAICLIVCIHDKGSNGPDIIGLEAGPTRLSGLAISGSLATSVVYVGFERYI